MKRFALPLVCVMLAFALMMPMAASAGPPAATVDMTLNVGADWQTQTLVSGEGASEVWEYNQVNLALLQMMDDPSRATLVIWRYHWFDPPSDPSGGVEQTFGQVSLSVPSFSMSGAGAERARVHASVPLYREDGTLADEMAVDLAWRGSEVLWHDDGHIMWWWDQVLEMRPTLQMNYLGMGKQTNASVTGTVEGGDLHLSGADAYQASFAVYQNVYVAPSVGAGE